MQPAMGTTVGAKALARPLAVGLGQRQGLLHKGGSGGRGGGHPSSATPGLARAGRWDVSPRGGTGSAAGPGRVAMTPAEPPQVRAVEAGASSQQIWGAVADPDIKPFHDFI